MKPVHLFTDSCSDLGGDIRSTRNIDYLKMCTVTDGKEEPADLDYPTYAPADLYNTLRAGTRILTTQVPMGEFKTRFTEVLEAGEAIVYIGCALPLSKSVETGTMVARELCASYPDAEIYCIDATNCSLGEGLLTVYAADLRDAGSSAAEIVAAVEEKKHYVNQYVTVGTLDYLKRAGRVKGSKAFFGNLLGVKPIIISDKNGQNVPVAKAKGRKASMDALVNMTKETVADAASQTVFIGHADCLADAEYLKEKLLSEVGFKDAYINFIGPIVGASIGPDALAVFSFGQRIEVEA